MAKVANPRKVFNFRVEIDGIDQFEIQEINIPEAELEVTEHGDTNHNIGTAGRIKFGDITLKKLRPLPTADKWAWDWVRRIQDVETGGGQLPSQYKKIIAIKELSADNATTVSTWICKGVFPKKVSMENHSRTSSDNMIQTVVLWADKVIP